MHAGLHIQIKRTALPGVIRVLAAIVLCLTGHAGAQDKARSRVQIGDPAPVLATGRWLKGEPVERLATGTPYVVEFWSSWCDTCMYSIPQLTRLQRQYAGDGLVCIGVNVWDEPERAAAHVRDHDDQFGFRVALDQSPPEGNPRSGASARSWVEAAGRDKPPVAFLVDRQGRIVWIGHPLALRGVFDEMVRLLVQDKLTPEHSRDLGARYADLEARSRVIMARCDKAMADEDFPAAAAAMDDLIDLSPSLFGLRGVVNRFHITLVLQRDYRGSYAWAREIGKRFWDDAYVLNAIAWAVLDTDGLEVRDLDLAMKFARRSCDLTGNANAAFLDTLARAYFETGDVDKALDVEGKALLLAEPEIRKELQAALDKYRAWKAQHPR